MPVTKPLITKYHELTKQTGYRSREAFKLTQLNQIHHFLEKCNIILDLCAAPGSWLQVATQTMTKSSIKIGIDSVKFQPIRGCLMITTDINKKEGEAEIKKHLEDNKADVILYNRVNVKDNMNEAYLCLRALEVASQFLKNNGILIMKMIKSKHFESFKCVLMKLFEKVYVEEPDASKWDKGEKFFVCLRFKGNQNFNSKLFSTAHVFGEEVDNDAESDDVDESDDVNDSEEEIDVSEDSEEIEDIPESENHTLSKKAKMLLERDDLNKLLSEDVSDCSSENEELEEEIPVKPESKISLKRKLEKETKQVDKESSKEPQTKKSKKDKIILTPEERALALKMVTSRKMRREIIDWSYGKRMFDDTGCKLPKWFVKEEKEHSRRPLPFITKEDIKEQEIQMYGAKAVNKRTIKKVELSKNRKKNKLGRRYKKVFNEKQKQKKKQENEKKKLENPVKSNNKLDKKSRKSGGKFSKGPKGGMKSKSQKKNVK